MSVLFCEQDTITFFLCKDQKFMITIKEIAKQLNMSTTTVSNVIHGKVSEVSDETRTKVEEFLKKVDYVPNINARNLAQN